MDLLLLLLLGPLSARKFGRIPTLGIAIAVSLYQVNIAAFTPKPNFYRILRVANFTPIGDIQTAYRNLAKEVHPDVSDVDDDDAKFRLIATAKRSLTRQPERQDYHRYGDFAMKGEVELCGVDHRWWLWCAEVRREALLSLSEWAVPIGDRELPTVIAYSLLHAIVSLSMGMLLTAGVPSAADKRRVLMLISLLAIGLEILLRVSLQEGGFGNRYLPFEMIHIIRAIRQLASDLVVLGWSAFQPEQKVADSSVRHLGAIQLIAMARMDMNDCVEDLLRRMRRHRFGVADGAAVKAAKTLHERAREISWEKTSDASKMALQRLGASRYWNPKRRKEACERISDTSKLVTRNDNMRRWFTWGLMLLMLYWNYFA